jgi:hypothetical protein
MGDTVICCLAGAAVVTRIALMRRAGLVAAIAATLVAGALAADHVAARAAADDFANPPLCITERLAIALR